jgi:anti-sigma factor RsiW
MAHVLSCREFVEFLDDYLAGALPPEQRAAFDAHLAQCPSCVAYMNSYRAAVRLGRAALEAATLPPDVPEQLVRAILEARRLLRP